MNASSTGAFSLLWGSLKRHPLQLLGLAALATLPTEILGDALGWNMMDPASYLAEALWFPVFILCELALLRLLGRDLNPGAGRPPLGPRALGSATGAEMLLGLRFSVVVLLCSLPALSFLAIFGLEPLWARIALGLIAALGAIPCILWMLHRLFSPAIILWQGLNASASIEESARISRGKLGKLLWPLLALNGIGLILEGLSSFLGSGSYAALPLSFLLSSAALAWAYRILTL